MEASKQPPKIEVRTFTLPPSGFIASKATDKELTIYGFPKRPVHDRQLLERWEKIFSLPMNMITPLFSPLDRKRHHPAKDAPLPPHGMDNATGAFIYHPNGGRIKWVSGTFTVPNTYPPVHAQKNVWYAASLWIGIDYFEGQVMQAGCDSMVRIKDDGTLFREMRVWWEWYPDPPQRITNFEISQGDTISCLIICPEWTTSQASVFLYNLTSQDATNFLITSNNLTIKGHYAEWMVERLVGNVDQTYDLARFGEVYFDEMTAGTVDKETIPGGTGSSKPMLDDVGNILATTKILNSNLIQVKYAGPNS